MPGWCTVSGLGGHGDGAASCSRQVCHFQTLILRPHCYLRVPATLPLTGMGGGEQNPSCRVQAGKAFRAQWENKKQGAKPHIWGSPLSNDVTLNDYWTSSCWLPTEGGTEPTYITGVLWGLDRYENLAGCVAFQGMIFISPYPSFPNPHTTGI